MNVSADCVWEEIEDTHWQCLQCGRVRRWTREGQPPRRNCFGRNGNVPHSPPAMLTRIVNFAKALPEVISDTVTGNLRGEDEMREILSTWCARCPLFNGQVCTHVSCGCNLGRDEVFLNKLRYRSQNCPLGFWPTFAPTMPLEIQFLHGLGDVVQLGVVLRHLRHYFQGDFEINLEVRAGYERVLVPGVATAAVQEFQGHDANRWRYHLCWPEPDQCFAHSPSTKAERCLWENWRMAPVEELCRYELQVHDDCRQAAREYLATIPGRPVLVQYLGASGRERKDLSHRQAANLCMDVQAAGFTPLLIDWPRESPLPDDRTIFRLDSGSPYWQGRCNADAARLVGLVAEAAAFIGIDSGPGHVAGAVGTPAAIIWTGNHPVHYYGLSDALHLVPEHHADNIRNPRADGLAYFEANYRHRVYFGHQIDVAAFLKALPCR